MTPEWKGEVPTLDLLNRMVTDPLPLGLRSGPVEPFFQRDIYFDSADWTLRRRGVSCRFRIRVDDRRMLTLRTVGRWEGGVPLVLPQTFEADVAELEGEQALAGTSDPARRLRSLIDPALLLPRIQFETERRLRYTRAGWFSRGRYAVVYDVVTVRSHQMAQAFEELKLRELARGRPGLDRLARAFQQQYGLRPLLVGKADRAAKLLRDLESGALAQVARGGREVAVVAVGRAARRGRLARLERPTDARRARAGGAVGHPGRMAAPQRARARSGPAAGARAPGATVRVRATPPHSRRRPPRARALPEQRPESDRVQRPGTGAGGGSECSAPCPDPISFHPEREPGRVFYGARRHAETRGSKRWAGGGGAPCHRDPGAGPARAAGSLFQGRVPPGPRRAWRPDPAVVGRVGGSTGGPAPLLHGGSVSLDHAAGHDPRAWAPLPTHSQLAPLPRHRGARRAGRTNALCLPEGAGDAPPLSDARGRERLRRGGGCHPREPEPGLPGTIRRRGVRVPRDARRRPRAGRAQRREPAAGDRGRNETPALRRDHADGDRRRDAGVGPGAVAARVAIRGSSRGQSPGCGGSVRSGRPPRPRCRARARAPAPPRARLPAAPWRCADRGGPVDFRDSRGAGYPGAPPLRCVRGDGPATGDRSGGRSGCRGDQTDAVSRRRPLGNRRSAAARGGTRQRSIRLCRAEGSVRRRAKHRVGQ